MKRDEGNFFKVRKINMKKLMKGFGIFGSLLAAVLFEWAYVDTSKRHNQSPSSKAVPVGRIYHSELVTDDQEVLAPTAAAAA